MGADKKNIFCYYEYLFIFTYKVWKYLVELICAGNIST